MVSILKMLVEASDSQTGRFHHTGNTRAVQPFGAQLAGSVPQDPLMSPRFVISFIPHVLIWIISVIQWVHNLPIIDPHFASRGDQVEARFYNGRAKRSVRRSSRTRRDFQTESQAQDLYPAP